MVSAAARRRSRVGTAHCCQHHARGPTRERAPHRTPQGEVTASGLRPCGWPSTPSTLLSSTWSHPAAGPRYNGAAGTGNAWVRASSRRVEREVAPACGKTAACARSTRQALERQAKRTTCPGAELPGCRPAWPGGPFSAFLMASSRAPDSSFVCARSHKHPSWALARVGSGRLGQAQNIPIDGCEHPIDGLALRHTGRQATPQGAQADRTSSMSLASDCLRR